MIVFLQKIPKLQACFLGLFLLGAVNHYILDWPITLGFDPNDEKCLPGVHLTLLVKSTDVQPKGGDYVFWRPQGALQDVKQAFIMKRVAGVAGDHLTVRNGLVKINGHQIADGLPLIDPSKVSPSAFDRDEVIPVGKLFMVADHPHSYDSRYWGYLDVSSVVGMSHVLF